jgi:acetylornithine/succinyldiaminopimelate/putrescine aminotransferase
VEVARRLGIPNATHNNTRGHAVRLLEEELVRTAAGIPVGDTDGLTRLLQSRKREALNRVLNLETGSLAAEAALKMTLSRFYQAQADSPPPKYTGRIPVVLVVGDDEGDISANYHGTTVLTQVLRGMWPQLRDGLETRGLFVVRSVRPNDVAELDRVFERYNGEPYHIAGFFHELILMNYGARRLKDEFVRRAYGLCRKYDVPAVVDEIQTGIWSPELYLFKEYKVKPDIVVLGKGFPGGEFAASRVLFGSAMDSLPQFGALVTNGQEELASMAYLVTIRWAEANADVTGAVGEFYEERLHDLAERHAPKIERIEGRRHLAGVCFQDLTVAKRFVERLNKAGFDISVQTYKEECPPTALTKLPLTAGYEAVDFLVDRMDAALAVV